MSFVRRGWGSALRLVVVLLVGVLLASVLGFVDSESAVAQSPPPQGSVDGPVVAAERPFNTGIETVFKVPRNWSLNPAGIQVGDDFRLLFKTSTRRNGLSNNVDVFNAYVQAAAARGHGAIREHSSYFRSIVGVWGDSTDPVSNAELRRGTDIEAPIFWLNGPRVSQDYSTTDGVGFNANRWENWGLPDRRNEFGAQADNDYPWTGSISVGLGIQEGSSWSLRNDPNGSAFTGGYDGDDTGSPMSIQGETRNLTEEHSFYAISPVYQVTSTVVTPELPSPLVEMGSAESPVVRIFYSGADSIVEGGLAYFTVFAHPAPARPIRVNLGLLHDLDFGARLRNGSSVLLSSSRSAAQVVVTTVDDNADMDLSLRGRDLWNKALVDAGAGSFTLVLLEGQRYRLAHSDEAPSAKRVRVTDNDNGAPEVVARRARCLQLTDNLSDAPAVLSTRDCVWPPPGYSDAYRFVEFVASSSGFTLGEGESREVVLTFSRRTLLTQPNDRIRWLPDAGAASFVNMVVLGNGVLNDHNQVRVRVSARQVDDPLPNSVVEATRPWGYNRRYLWNGQVRVWRPHVENVTVSGVFALRQPRFTPNTRAIVNGREIDDSYLDTPKRVFRVTVLNDDFNADADFYSMNADAKALILDIRKNFVWSGDRANITRWRRVLVLLNAALHGSNEPNWLPMTLAEARSYAARGAGWERWHRVVNVLEVLGFPEGVNNKSFVPQSLIADVRSYAAETSKGAAHVTLWKRVLLALGEQVWGGFTESPITLTEAQGYANQFSSVRWDPVVTALTMLQTAQAQPQSENTEVVPRSENTDDTQQESSYTVPAQLIADVRGYAAETGNGEAHVHRWKRVMLAFGESVPGFTGSPMTAAEAQSYADKGWTRWNPIVTVLTALQTPQTTQSQPQSENTEVVPQSENTDDTQQVSSYTVPAQLIAAVQSYAAETIEGTAHVTRWRRVLLAFGETVSGFTGTPMTAAEAQSYADKGWARWDPVVTALTALEANQQQSQQQPSSDPAPPADPDPTPVDPVPVPADPDPVPADPVPVVTPVVSVTAGNAVTEGGAASFTLTANPAPVSPVDVTVNVTATGDYGVTTGNRTVTIATSGTATLTVSTSGDSIDEANGSVTVTVVDGAAYDLGSSSSATVAINDNDDPPPPPPPLPASELPVLSITDGSFTEGNRNGYYIFFVTLSEPAAKPVQVRYRVETTGTGAGHATGDIDYVSVGSSIYFRPGITRNIGLVIINDDTDKEPDETLRIVLTNPQNAQIGNNGEATLTIKDND